MKIDDKKSAEAKCQKYSWKNSTYGSIVFSSSSSSSYDGRYNLNKFKNCNTSQSKCKVSDTFVFIIIKNSGNRNVDNFNSNSGK